MIISVYHIIELAYPADHQIVVESNYERCFINFYFQRQKKNKKQQPKNKKTRLLIEHASIEEEGGLVTRFRWLRLFLLGGSETSVVA